MPVTLVQAMDLVMDFTEREIRADELQNTLIAPELLWSARGKRAGLFNLLVALGSAGMLSKVQQAKFEGIRKKYYGGDFTVPLNTGSKQP